MSLTGGKLNLLNGQYGISASKNSVAVMKLIRTHSPKTKSELEDLIASHSTSRCSCGIISQGTIQDFGKNLYDAQFKEWKKEVFSLTECIQWEYDLFITQSLKGNKIESNAISTLKENFPTLTIKEAKGYIDEELRVDVIINDSNKKEIGVQIKPATFKMMRQNVISFNKVANKKWGKPVAYLFYDDKENFENLDDVVNEIMKFYSIT